MADVSGKRLSAHAAGLLSNWMLPSEPIVGAVAGTVGLQNVWLVLTPQVVIYLRDGRTAHIDDLIDMSEVTGWQGEEGWTGFKFMLGTNRGMLTIGQVNANRAVAFTHALQAVDANIGRSGVPVAVEPALIALDELVGALEAAGSAPEVVEHLGDLSPVALMARDVGGAIARASVAAGAQLLYEHVLLLDALAMASGIVQPGPRGERVLEFVELCQGDTGGPLSAAIWEQVRSTSAADGWKAVLDHSALIVESAASLLPSNASLRQRTPFQDEARRFKVTGAATPALAGEGAPRGASPGPDDDLITRLERLQRLLESGAITSAEFETLKRAAMGL